MVAAVTLKVVVMMHIPLLDPLKKSFPLDVSVRVNDL